MKIGILAKLTGTTNPIIRSYEKEGLLDHSCMRGGHREFPPQALAQVELARAARSLKWTLQEVRILMRVVRGTEKDPRQLLDLFSRCEFQVQLGRLLTLENFLLGKALASERLEAQVLRMGRLAQLTGAKPNELISMVSNGLLPCRRDQAGRREFHSSAVQRVQLILAWRMLGLSVGQTQEVLAHPCLSEMRKRYQGVIADRRGALKLIMEVQDQLLVEQISNMDNKIPVSSTKPYKETLDSRLCTPSAPNY